MPIYGGGEICDMRILLKYAGKNAAISKICGSRIKLASLQSSMGGGRLSEAGGQIDVLTSCEGDLGI